jgi:predicted dehydrogenase
LKIYNRNPFTKEASIEVSCPVVDHGKILIEVEYAVNVPGILNKGLPANTDPAGSKIQRAFWGVRKAAALSLQYSFRQILRSAANKQYRDARAAFAKYVSISGIVREVGAGVKDIQIGDYVAGFGFLQPGVADFVLLPAETVYKVANPTERNRPLFALAFFGSAAAFVFEKVSLMGNVRVERSGTALWADIALKMLNKQETSSSVLKKVTLIGNGTSDDVKAERCFKLAETPGSENCTALLLPDPYRTHNLNMHSRLELELPEWLLHKYLANYISFAECYTGDTGFLKEFEKYIIKLPESGSPKPIIRKVTRKKANETDAKLSVGVIGAGEFANIMLLKLMNFKNLSLVGIADRNPDRAWLSAETFDFTYSTSDADVIINDDLINCVFIFTDHASHAPLAVECLKRRKYVYLEKPHAITQEQLDALLNEVEEDNYHVQVGFNRRFAPAISIAKKWLALEQKPVNITFNVRAYDVPPNSFYHWATQGSRIISNICHHLDLSFYIAGSRPRVINTITSNKGRPDENAVVTVSFENGSLCNILFGSQGDDTVLGQEIIRFMSGNTTIDINNFSAITVRKKGEIVENKYFNIDFGHSQSLKNFIDNVEQQKRSIYTKNDIRWVAQLFLAADASARQGAPVYF